MRLRQSLPTVIALTIAVALILLAAALAEPAPRGDRSAIGDGSRLVAGSEASLSLRSDAAEVAVSPPQPTDAVASSAPADPSVLPLAPVSPGTVPILYYHRVQSPPAVFAEWSLDRQRRFLAYDVLPTAFSAQLDWLAKSGYTTILPGKLADHWDHGAPLPARPVILTFDDGFPDWVTTVLPALRARHMVGEFYLTLDAIATGSITWPEVRRLARGGNGIGGHDVHHVQLVGLGQGRPDASVARMWFEIHEIRRTIAAHIGVVPDSMAYVGGGFNATLEGLVREAGYTTARSIERGVVQSISRRFELRVVRIGARDDVVDIRTGTLVPGLPTFVQRLHGVTDQRPRTPAHT